MNTKKCTNCQSIKPISEFHKNKNKTVSQCKQCKNEYRHKYYTQNSKKSAQQSKKYANIHQEKIKDYHKTYSKNNRKKILNCRKKWYKTPKGKDALLKSNLSKRIRSFINKKQKTLNIIGCSLNFLKEHLQQTAIRNGYINFNINNYNRKHYHIDHIIPCSIFNLSCSYHQKLCFHWSNLQILTSTENILKSNKILYSNDISYGI